MQLLLLVPGPGQYELKSTLQGGGFPPLSVAMWQWFVTSLTYGLNTAGVPVDHELLTVRLEGRLYVWMDFDELNSGNRL